MGVSLEAQESMLRSYCAMRGAQLVELVIDSGVSGAKPLGTRPAGARIIELVRRRRVQAVVAWKLDRLFRDCADCLDVTRAWDKAGVALHLVDLGGQAVDTSSAMGRFFVTVMAGAAELERNQVCDRTRAAMQHKRKMGEFTGGAAGRVRYGYAVGADGVSLAPNHEEQAVLMLARSLRAAGRSVRDVVQELAARGHRSRVGRAFAYEQVRRMLVVA